MHPFVLLFVMGIAAHDPPASAPSAPPSETPAPAPATPAAQAPPPAPVPPPAAAPASPSTMSTVATKARRPLDRVRSLIRDDYRSRVISAVILATGGSLTVVGAGSAVVAAWMRYGPDS